MDDCELSLILPAFNEQAGIARAIAEAEAALVRLGITFEILVVDDGSDDGTGVEVQREIANRPTVRYLRHDTNQGYGAALRTGFERARGKRIAFTDADCQFHLDDLASLLALIDRHPIAIGYRVDRQDTYLRKLYSRGYNFIARTLLGTSVRDIDCALKVFRRDALARILPETKGFFVNTEMLTRASQLGIPVAEAGVRHRPRQGGESKVSIRDIPRTLNTLLPFWWMKVMFPATAPQPANGCARSWIPHMLGLLLAFVTCTLFFSRLDHPLLEPEEARYAEIPRQMLAEGRVMTPVLHGEDYWQKPPLLYWLIMASYQIFGVHDWAARLVPCLAGIGCVGIVTWWGWRTLGSWAGLAAGGVLTLSMRYLYLAGMVSMDGLLCTCVVAGLAFGHVTLSGERRWWLALSAVACALGVLTKGPVAVLLILAPLSMYACLDRRSRFFTPWEGLAFCGVVAVIAGPWFVVMTVRSPEAAGTFVWLHNVARYFSPVDHEKPVWFFAPSLLLGMLPWSLLLIPMLPYLLRRSVRAGQRRPAALGMFVIAFCWCVGFFSLSGCKRPGYILPGLPLFALMVGTFLVHGLPWQRGVQAVTVQNHHWAQRLTLSALSIGVIISVAAALSGMWTWTETASAAMLFAALAALVMIMPRRIPAWTSWGTCAAGVFLLLCFGQRAWLPDYHDRFGLRRQVEISSAHEQDEDLPILTYPKRWDSIGYYAKRSDIESYAPAELAQLHYELHRHGKAILFVRREGLPEIQGSLPDNLELEVLGKKDEFVVVGLVRPRHR